MPDSDLLSHRLRHYHRRTGVSRSCSGWEGVGPPCSGRQALNFKGKETSPHNPVAKLPSFLALSFLAAPSMAHQGHGDKPLGRLVTVSSTCRHASTPVLSTSWSRTALQGVLDSGKSHLEAGFPLRCLQRLSLPDLATRPCHWRDNRCTRGPSTPVLSYWEQPLSDFQRPRQIGTKLSHDVLNPAHVPL